MPRSMRFLPLFVVALMASLSLTSCEPDDDNYYSFVGTWEEVAPNNGFFTFYNNGSGYWSDYYGNQDWFDWWTSGQSITIQWDDYPTDYYNWSFAGNSLYLYPYNGGNPIVLQPY